MRDYAKVSPAFWTRGSGKRLRGNVHAQLVGLYVVTCPNANMVGVYYLPLVTIVHETGLTERQARDALRVLAEADFAHYDEGSDLVWVPNAASYQMGDGVDLGPKRRTGVQRELETIGRHRFVVEFFRRYAEAYRIEPPAWVQEALSIPHAKGIDGVSGSGRYPIEGAQNQEQEQEQEQEQDVTAPPAEAGVPNERSFLTVVEVQSKTKRGTRIPSDWKPKSETLEAFRREGVDAEPIVAEFVDYWIAVAGAKGVKLDWDATFRNRVRQVIEQGRAPRWVPKASPPKPADDDLPDVPPEEAKRIIDEAMAVVHSKVIS